MFGIITPRSQTGKIIFSFLAAACITILGGAITYQLAYTFSDTYGAWASLGALFYTVPVVLILFPVLIFLFLKKLQVKNWLMIGLFTSGVMLLLLGFASLSLA